MLHRTETKSSLYRCTIVLQITLNQCNKVLWRAAIFAGLQHTIKCQRGCLRHRAADKRPRMFMHQQTSSALPHNLLCTPSLPSCNLKTLRGHENSSMLSPGQRANSISRQAYTAFCSFQYPWVPAATLANRYQAGLFTDIFRRYRAFSVSGISKFEKGGMSGNVKANPKSVLLLLNNVYRDRIPNGWENKL